MNKTTVKLFILFVFTISILFFSLILFQKHTMKRQMPGALPPPMLYNMKDAPFNGAYNLPDKTPKEPPFAVPAVLIILISSGFVFLILKYVDKNFITPFVLVENGVKRIKDGDFEVEFKTKSENPAVCDTFATLNTMTSKLKEKQKLEESFAAMLSHDLRAPLMAQERAIRILKEDFKDHELLDGMLENNADYLRMINLIIETFCAKEYTVKKEEIDFSKLIDTVLLALNPLIKEKNIKIIKDIPSQFKIFADYISFNRILVNLISNSIENLKNEGEIEIKGYKKDDKTFVSIKDNGDGISKNIINKIFDKHTSYKLGKKVAGGLGLYIASELIKKNDAKISVISEEGKYTEFLIEI